MDPVTVKLPKYHVYHKINIVIHEQYSCKLIRVHQASKRQDAISIKTRHEKTVSHFWKVVFSPFSWIPIFNRVKCTSIFNRFYNVEFNNRLWRSWYISLSRYDIQYLRRWKALLVGMWSCQCCIRHSVCTIVGRIVQCGSLRNLSVH